MKLSIIIVSYNTKELLSDCLTSLYRSCALEFKQKEYEIIIVDNGSSDGSIEVLQKEYKEVLFIQNRENSGFGAANNIGIQKAKGTTILLLNPDTIIPEKTLRIMVEFLNKNPKIGIATCYVQLKNGMIDDASHRGFPTPWRALTHFSGLGRLFPQTQFFNGYHLGYANMDRPHEIDACAGAFLMIKKSVGNEVGWFDEDYFWYGEDLDLCYRVKQAGYSVMFNPDVSIIHYKGASSGIKKHSQALSKIDAQTKQKITKARFEVMRIFYKKHYTNKYPAWLMQLVFLGIAVKQKMTELIT